MPDLNTPFLDLTPYWGIGVLLVAFAILWMVIQAAKHGAKKGEPAHLGRYAACAIIVLFMLWIASNVNNIKDGDSFHQVGCTAKMTSGCTPPTTR